MCEEERVQNILKWRESLSKLPDHHFFALLRMYLGEIKTPYNKQTLIERLSAFLRLPQVRENAAKLLDKTDVLLVAASRELPEPTLEKITLFFAGTFTPRQVRELLYNLEERLILFRAETAEKRIVFCINPLLYESVKKITGGVLLTAATLGGAEKNTLGGAKNPCPITPLFLAAWFSFIFNEQDLCKTDGNLKKRAELLLETVFPQLAHKNGLSFAAVLLASLKNLQLIHQQNCGLVLDYERWRSFAELDSISCRAYLAAASCGRFTRSELAKLARFILELSAAIPSGGCTGQALYRCAFLLRERENGSPKTSRVAAIMQRRTLIRNEDSPESGQQEASIESILEKMLLFGFLREENALYFAVAEQKPPSSGSPVRIDAGFTVTILPELELSRLLPLVQFLRIIRFDTAASFEITRQGALRAFSGGLVPADILKLLAEYTGHTPPQNLVFSLEDWFSAFSSVTLYKGYVLQISEDRRHLIENNAFFARYLVKKIADNVYLLDFSDDDEAAAILKKSGLLFSGTVCAAKKNSEVLPYLSVNVPRRAEAVLAEQPEVRLETFAGHELLLSLRKELDKRGFSHEETDSLKSRIERRIILLPEQLRADSVRFEKTEAGGMDFLGKIQVLEHAAATDSLVEITYEEIAGGAKSEKVFSGIPVSLEKRDGDAVVIIKSEEGGEKISLPVAKAVYVRRIRGSIFKDSI